MGSIISSDSRQIPDKRVYDKQIVKRVDPSTVFLGYFLSQNLQGSGPLIALLRQWPFQPDNAWTSSMLTALLFHHSTGREGSTGWYWIQLCLVFVPTSPHCPKPQLRDRGTCSIHFVLLDSNRNLSQRDWEHVRTYWQDLWWEYLFSSGNSREKIQTHLLQH